MVWRADRLPTGDGSPRACRSNHFTERKLRRTIYHPTQIIGFPHGIGMRAIIIKEFGGLDGLVIENLPDPEPKPGNVLIEVKAFGINHAETHMRKGEWAEAAKVSGSSVLGL